MHIPWDAAGCLCPVGDLFNYSAPAEESDLKNMDHKTHDLTLDDIYTENKDFDSGRLTDGRFENDVGAYCFYAKKSYRKGEQVLWTSLLFFFFYLAYNLSFVIL